MSTLAHSAASASAEITVTSFHPSPAAGGVLIGRAPDGTLWRALLPPNVGGRNPERGEMWRVTGPVRVHLDYGPQIHAEVALPLVPSGRALVRYLATNHRFPGVGFKIADRLWNALGTSLYDVLKAGDASALAPVVGADIAIGIIGGFGLLAEEVEVFRYFDRYGVASRTAVAASRIWGRGAISRIDANPYALALLEPWSLVDARALRIGLSLDDPRRLMAAVEEAFARRYRSGNMAATPGEINAQLWQLLGFAASRLGDGILATSISAGRAVVRPGGLIQSRAASFMEREIERLLAERLVRGTVSPPPDAVEAAIAELERARGVTFSPCQIAAVRMAVASGVSVLRGGAGTGKTMTVAAILAVSRLRRGPDGQEFDHPLLAVAGRAAKRIAEATGRPASTVARFVRRLEMIGKAPKRGLLVVDEASMLDTPSLYRVLTLIPGGLDILFVGDPIQLAPIGPGMPFRSLVSSTKIPSVELDIIHRQDAATGIPAVGKAIRNGHLPSLPRFDPKTPDRPGVFFMPAGAEDVGAATIDVFRALAGPAPARGDVDALHARDVQVLCALKNGLAGVKDINGLIEAEWMTRQPRVHNWGLSIGSKIIWLKNDYTKSPIQDGAGSVIVDPLTGRPACAGFMNGSIGTIRRVTRTGAWIELDDGAADEITAADLERLTGGWAISVHKAQGSAFRRVIVPVLRSRLLDRTLLYTAVTRAVETCVLIGDFEMIREAVERQPRAHSRRDSLDIDAAMHARTQT